MRHEIMNGVRKLCTNDRGLKIICKELSKLIDPRLRPLIKDINKVSETELSECLVIMTDVAEKTYNKYSPLFQDEYLLKEFFTKISGIKQSEYPESDGPLKK